MKLARLTKAQPTASKNRSCTGRDRLGCKFSVTERCLSRSHSWNRNRIYKNHPQITPAWIFGVLLPFFLNFVWASYRLIQSVTIEAVLDLAMAVAFLILWWFVRRMALTVQDRVIRLEMRLRLRELLPANMHADILRLTRSQLVALEIRQRSTSSPIWCVRCSPERSPARRTSR